MTNKVKIENPIHLGRLLEFDVVFPNEQALTPEEYLKGGNKDIILNVASFFLGFNSFNSKYDDTKVLLESIFGRGNSEFANQLYIKIKALENDGGKIKIINTYSSLRLFEYFFSKPREIVTQSNDEFEISLFKSYLVLNSEFTQKQNIAFTSTKELDVDSKIAMMLFCMEYPVSDKSNYDINQIWTTQAIKSIYLFQFLESNKRTQHLLRAFLAYYECSTWEEYLKSLLPLTFSAINHKAEAHTDINIEQNDKFKQTCNFIDKLILNDNDELNENDFLTLRSKPIYKIKDGVYRIIYNLFLVEKIFKGAYFSLKHVNETLPTGEKVPGLKGIYGHEFSEQTLLYRIIDIIYSDKCIKFSGKQLTDMNIDGAPDYYIRKSKTVLLFESKDFLIRADKKESFDFNIYEEEFTKTLYYEILPNGKEKHGAVMQLITSIKRILKNELKADTNYYYKDLYIYPIIITHDHQYDTPGFNDIINSWFQDEVRLLEDEGFFIHRIKPLSVINIDSLIFHQVGLSNNASLHVTLDAFHDYIKLKPLQKFKSIDEYKSYAMSRMIPFSHFIDNYFDKRGIWKVPPILETLTPALFKEELGIG